MDDPADREAERAARRRRLTVIDGTTALIAILVIVQMWILTATLDAALGGRDEAALPAAIASGVLFLLSALLVRFAGRD
jgi:hypothetical protein